MTMEPPDYHPRIVDTELDELCSQLPAIAVEGAKGVGKTRTASRRTVSTFSLDDPVQRELLIGDPHRLTAAPPPVLVDEWQRVPETWDIIRRAVDNGAAPGQFLLAGSASPRGLGTHSGAGRIVSVQMRPLSLAERWPTSPVVSLGATLSDALCPIEGNTNRRLEDYTHEIVATGFPGFRDFSGRPLRTHLDSYISRLLDRDLPELGLTPRNPVGLRRWLTAYAAATATTTRFEAIRDAATAGVHDKPARATVAGYRDALERLWILDPLAAWQPRGTHIRLLAHPPKHHLVDPALAAHLLGFTSSHLLAGKDTSPALHHDGPFLGALFESLVTLSVRVYAQAAEARVYHLRTAGGEHEIDLIVERNDGSVVAIEVKLSRSVEDRDVRHLLWLRNLLGDSLINAMVITTGPTAYRRSDGIAVVPASLLGP